MLCIFDENPLFTAEVIWMRNLIEQFNRAHFNWMILLNRILHEREWKYSEFLILFKGKQIISYFYTVGHSIWLGNWWLGVPWLNFPKIEFLRWFIKKNPPIYPFLNCLIVRVIIHLENKDPQYVRHDLATIVNFNTWVQLFACIKDNNSLDKRSLSWRSKKSRIARDI